MPTSNRFYEIEKKAIDFIAANELILEGEKVLLALSGGPDSVFALHILNKYSSQLNFTIEAAHINHMLRGEESIFDESFCLELCEKLGVKFQCKQIDILALKNKSKGSKEEIARKERYKFFAELSKQHCFDKIVTAHNKNDNVETVLLNLIKGSGLGGMAGIPICRGNIVRPLLSITKTEILEYLHTHELSYRSDSSNESLEFERNYIRNKLIPQIEKTLNPKLVNAVTQTSTNLRMVNNLIQKWVDESWERFVSTDESTFDIKVALFDLEDEALVGEILKKLFTEKLGIEFSSQAFNSINELSRNQVGKRIDLANGFEAVRERQVIKILIPNAQNDVFVEFSPGKCVTTNTFEITTEIIDVADYVNRADNSSEFISADNLDDIFILRNWKSGDRFIPLGMKGHKKISDYLTDLKIPSVSKKGVCVLTCGDNIVWIVGFGIDDRYKIDNNTKRVCKLCLKRL